MNEKDKRILEHILDDCTDIQDSMQRFGDQKELFVKDRDYRNSVCMSRLQIGELEGRFGLRVDLIHEPIRPDDMIEIGEQVVLYAGQQHLLSCEIFLRAADLISAGKPIRHYVPPSLSGKASITPVCLGTAATLQPFRSLQPYRS